MFESSRAHQAHKNRRPCFCWFPTLSLNFSRLVKQRARGDLSLSLGALIAVFLATTTVAGGPVYLRSLERVGMADVVKTAGPYYKNVSAISDWIPLEHTEITQANSVVDSAVSEQLEPLIEWRSTRIKSRSHFWGLDDGDPNTQIETVRGESASRAYFHEMEGLHQVVTYVDGRAPTSNLRIDEDGDRVVEVAVYENRSRRIRHGDVLEDLRVGDLVLASSVSRGFGSVKGEIVGIFVADDLRDQFWLGSPNTILEPEPPMLFGGRDKPIILFTAEGAIAPGVGPSNAGLPMNYMRVLFTDREKISLARPGVFVAAVDQFEDIVKTELPQVKILSGMRASTNRMETKMLFLRLPVLLLAAFVVAVVGYYLFLVSGLIARKREHEIAMFRSRGLSIFQIFRLQIIEGVVVIVLPALVAPLFAALGIGLAGKLPVFKSLTGGSHLPVELSLSVWVWSGITALLVFLVLLSQVLVVARSGISSVDRSRARPDRPPVFQRFYFDILIMILGGFFVWEISTRGIAIADRDGGVATDVTLLFAPVMLLISTALLMLRVFPVVARVSYSIATRFTSAPLALGFWRLGRDPYWYSWPVLLLILGTGLGVMVGTLGATLERSAREQIFYDNGSNLRILPGGMNSNVRPQDIAEITAVGGVNTATMAFRQIAKFGTTSQGPAFNVLGIESESFSNIAWFRDDFSEKSIEDLLVNLNNASSKPAPLILPAGTLKITAWTKQDPYVTDHFFWIVLKDAEGRRVTVTLGQIGDNWSEQSGDVPVHLVDPIEITSLQTFMQAGGDGGAPTVWFIDDIKALGPDFEHMLLDFESEALWTPLPTSNGLDVTYIDAVEEFGVGDPGTAVGTVSLERGTIAGVRGVYRSATGKPLPAIVSDNFFGLTGAVLGQPAVVQISGGFVPINPIGTARLFPTLDPTDRPFMILDVETLLDFVELRGLVNIHANEIFADINPVNHTEVTEEIRGIYRGSSLLDRGTRLNESVIDPLTVAGWRGMSIVSLIIGGLALLLGYVTYLLANSSRLIHDSAYLRAMGLSKSGFIRSALIEHGIVGLLGCVVGASVGLFASRMAVSAIAYSETGRALLPPFFLQTMWLPVLVILFVVLSAGVISVGSSFVNFLRRPLHELTRSVD